MRTKIAVRAAVVGAAMAGVLLLAGCGASVGSPGATGSGEGSAAPSASASVSSQPSPQATPTPTAAASETPPEGIGWLHPDGWHVAEATVDGLRVRVAPDLAADPVLEPVLDGGVEYQLGARDRVLVIGGGVVEDGYVWWEVLGTPSGWSDLTLHGYVAGGPEGTEDAWLTDVADLGCPQQPTVDELAALVPFMRVACYDDAPLTFDAFAWTIPGEGYGGACGVGFEGVQVDWLQCENINHNWVNASGNTDATFLLHYNPDVLAAPDLLAIQGQPFTITGHFADPASDLCTGNPSSSSSDVTSVPYWDCAMKFVVDQLEQR